MKIFILIGIEVICTKWFYLTILVRNFVGIDSMSRKILVYSIFDDEFGPMPAFYLPADEGEELIMNLAVQSLTSSFFGDYKEDHHGKAIIALSIADLAMFIYYFIIPSSQSRGGTRPAAISILVNKSDENLLYDNTNYLENRIKQILPALKSEDPSVSTVELMRLYQDIKKIDQQLKKPVEQLPIKSISKIIKEEIFAKLLHCIISNQPVVIVGKDLKSIMAICNSITPLIPHKILIIEKFTADSPSIPAFDILAIEEQEWNKKPEIFESLIQLPVYSMDSGTLQNFEGDFIFTLTLLKKIRKMKTENEIETFIRISILKMIKKSEQLEEILEKTEKKIDIEVLLEKLDMKQKFLGTLLLLLGEKREKLEKKIDTKEERLKRFLASE
ncbi:MAG: hypothetical protein HWN66_13805 [Candidatus Helarchaeota archaeon]|nr:hypothetical protein [Candidatus Helarchaeota archaeon]